MRLIDRWQSWRQARIDQALAEAYGARLAAYRVIEKSSVIALAKPDADRSVALPQGRPVVHRNLLVFRTERKAS